MTSELVVGVVFGRPVGGKTTLGYICLPFLFSSRLLKPGKLAEYFLHSTGFDVITH